MGIDACYVSRSSPSPLTLQFITYHALPSPLKGARVRITEDGGFKVTDGPFAEAKEVIADFAIIDLSSKEAAIETRSSS
ncbi:MAG: YciI family protein [Gemmatimonadaceae bacterium]